MNNPTFIDEILADVDWRVSELATIKSIPIKYSFDPVHKDIHIKYSVPALYAIWEGFIKNTFLIYSNHLNSLSIKRENIAYPLLTHHLDSICNFQNPRHAFDKKRKMMELIDKSLTEEITISPNVPTESNVNLKVLNKILERYCITPADDKYEKGLNRLLLFRNKIAHGENALTVNMQHLTDFIKTIEDLMLDIIILIQDCEIAKTYFKPKVS